MEAPRGQSLEAEGSVSGEQPRRPMRVGATGVSESGRRLYERRPRACSFIHPLAPALDQPSAPHGAGRQGPALVLTGSGRHKTKAPGTHTGTGLGVGGRLSRLGGRDN